MSKATKAGAFGVFLERFAHFTHLMALALSSIHFSWAISFLRASMASLTVIL